jgi:AbrB family transcriptional regulator (stage V sporulation protein T)
MKYTGIIRRIDDLGRVIIPKEIRRTLNLKEGDPLEVYVADGMICFQKYDTGESYKENITRLIENLDEDYDMENVAEIKTKLNEALELLNETDSGGTEK